MLKYFFRQAAPLSGTSRLVNKSLLKEAIKTFAFKTNKRYDYFNKHLTWERC